MTPSRHSTNLSCPKARNVSTRARAAAWQFSCCLHSSSTVPCSQSNYSLSTRRTSWWASVTLFSMLISSMMRAFSTLLESLRMTVMTSQSRIRHTASSSLTTRAGASKRQLRVSISRSYPRGSAPRQSCTLRMKLIQIAVFRRRTKTVRATWASITRSSSAST